MGGWCPLLKTGFCKNEEYATMYEVNGMKQYKIGLLRGDGIGPEIVDSAVRVLEAVGK